MKRLRGWLFNLAAAVSLALLLVTTALWTHVFANGDLTISHSQHRTILIEATHGVISCDLIEIFLPGVLIAQMSYAPVAISHAYNLRSVMGYADHRASVWGIPSRVHSWWVHDWVVVACTTALLTWWMRDRGKRRAAQRLRNGICPNCGYDLRATPERCPECGMVPETVKGAAP
jgi:hypothetical protein